MCKWQNLKLLTLVVLERVAVSCAAARSFTSTLIFATALSFAVGLSAKAAPHFDAPMPEAKTDDASTNLDPFKKENISISQPPPLDGKMGEFVGRYNKANYFYSYRQEIEVHGGLVFGITDSSDDEDLMNGVLGFSYLLPRMTSPKWELGADLSFVGHGHLRASRRTIFNEKGSFRPYYELGVMHKMVPEEKFASLSNWDNYLFRAGIGMANILRPPKSVQIELEVAIGPEDLLVFFSYGYAWGF